MATAILVSSLVLTLTLAFLTYKLFTNYPKCKFCGEQLFPPSHSTYMRQQAFTHNCPKTGFQVLFREANGLIVPFEQSTYFASEKLICAFCEHSTMRYEPICSNCGKKPTSAMPSPPPYYGWFPGSNLREQPVHTCSVCGLEVITAFSTTHTCNV